MLRSLLVLLLLANYLMVVGVGLAASRPEVPAFSAAHPYVHSKHCQQQNYLRLDCFEQCNGHRSEAKEKAPTGAGLHFLAQLRGLDVHCATEHTLPALQPAFWHGAPEQPEQTGPALASGFAGQNYPPPRLG